MQDIEEDLFTKTNADKAKFRIKDVDFGEYNDKAIAILIIKELPDHFLVTPYIVDVKKWDWAESEGFSRDQIWEDERLQNMIFFPAVRKEMYEHLGISV